MNSQEFYPFRTDYCRFIQIHAWDQSRNIDNLSHVHPVPSSSSSTNIFSPVWSPTSIEKTPHNPTLISISTHPSILRAVSEKKKKTPTNSRNLCFLHDRASLIPQLWAYEPFMSREDGVGLEPSVRFTALFAIAASFCRQQCVSSSERTAINAV